MRNATVRGILNRIVSVHNNGAWVVQQPPWNMDKEPDYGLWRVFEYDGNNGAKFSGLLQVWDWVYTILNSQQPFACAYRIMQRRLVPNPYPSDLSPRLKSLSNLAFGV